MPLALRASIVDPEIPLWARAKSAVPTPKTFSLKVTVKWTVAPLFVGFVSAGTIEATLGTFNL